MNNEYEKLAIENANRPTQIPPNLKLLASSLGLGVKKLKRFYRILIKYDRGRGAMSDFRQIQMPYQIDEMDEAHKEMEDKYLEELNQKDEKRN